MSKITVRQLKRLIKEAISEQLEMADVEEEDGESFADFISDLEELEMGGL
jgi:hypothetical protein